MCCLTLVVTMVALPCFACETTKIILQHLAHSKPDPPNREPPPGAHTAAHLIAYTTFMCPYKWHAHVIWDCSVSFFHRQLSQRHNSANVVDYSLSASKKGAFTMFTSAKTGEERLDKPNNFSNCFEPDHPYNTQTINRRFLIRSHLARRRTLAALLLCLASAYDVVHSRQVARDQYT